MVPNDKTFSIFDGIEAIRSVPKKYRTRYPALIMSFKDLECGKLSILGFHRIRRTNNDWASKILKNENRGLLGFKH